MGIQKNGLGSRVLSSVFYEVKFPATLPGRYARGPQKRSALGQAEALGRGLIAMELERSSSNLIYSAADLLRRGIHKEEHRRDEGGQAARQRRSLFEADKARAVLIQNKANRIGAGCHGGIHILRTGQSANLDPGTVVLGAVGAVFSG